MAGFAGNIDLRPLGVVAVLGQIVVLAQIGGVAIGAHVVPRLIVSGPVQRIGRPQLLAGIEVEPALAALLFAARIPSYDEALETAVGKWNQILLQGVDTEGIR